MSMTNFSKEISQLVENQFPEFYREEGTNLVAFIKAYYEFLETNDQYSVKLNRNMFDMRDIDTSLDEFLVQFKETYLADFPFKFRTDTKFAVKNIINYYRSKGSKESLELLMKLLFDEDVSIYYPGEDVLRLSDSSWYKPDYLEVTISSRNSSYINTEITGVKSGAKAFVESVVRKRVKGKVFDVMYLSSVRGTFFAGEKITNDGTTKNAPRIKGSLNDLDIVLGGRNNKIGDQFRVITDEGTGGLVKVSGIVNATGRVDFQIVDGGWGYTTESDTDVYVSSAVLFVNNSNESYFPYERVYQTLETVNIIDAADFTANAAIGSYVVGTTPSAAVCANGYIVSIANTYVDANNTVISTSNASSNAVMTILVSSGSYLDQRGLVLNSNAIGWGVNETITEETTETITITNLSGTFSVGEKVDQTTYETFGTAITNISGTLDANTFVITDVSSVAGLISGQPVTKVSGVGDFKVGTTIETIDAATNTITLNKKPLTSGAIVFNAGTYNVVTAYAFGTIQSANTSQVVLNQAWGEFTTSTLITGKTSGASALPTSITIANADIGAKGIVTSITNAANTASVKVLYGTFDATKQVRGDKSGLIYTINTSGQTGAFHVYLNGVNTANAIIRDSNDATVDGIVIGQDETSIGVHGNTAPFYFSNAYPSFVSTDRSYDTMISPPLDANNNIINVTNQITRIPGGRGADFEIGALTEIESGVTTYSDVVGEANIAGVPYTKIKISGEGSGYGYVQEVTVNYGGTGYINGSSVTFSGGGYGGGNPTVPATGHINVTAGVITAVVIDTYGSGYYESPTITIPNGSGANTTIVMNYGYGFPKNPNAEYYNTIGDVLNTNIVDVGRIALLNKINPGTEYSSNPFVKVRNKSIASFQRGDIILNVTGAGSTPFVAGEDLIQTVGGSTFVKGAVRAVNINDGVGQIFLRRKSTTIAIDTSLPIRGSATGASANVVNMISDPTSNYIGDNSIITGTAISASGVATKLEVVDSGFGYIEGGDVTLMAVANNQFVITAKTHADYQGISQGYWRTTTSHLNSEKRIQDNKYYQEYSYDVLSGLSLNKYEAILRNVFHVSGTRMFGSVVKSSDVNSMPSVVESSIVTTKPVITQLITQSGLVLTTQSGANLTVHKETVV
jgi:hypothetical protein